MSEETDSDPKVPLWFLGLTVLFGLMTMVIFGWMVRSSLEGTYHTGVWGDIAVEIASFPAVADTVFRELYGWTSDDYQVAHFVTPRGDIDLTRFQPVKSTTDHDIDGLLFDTVDGAAEEAWRLLVGVFYVDGEVEQAALLVSPKMDVVKVWILTEGTVSGHKPRPKGRKFIHGIAVLDDASLIFSFNGGISLQRVDRCGRLVWTIPGGFDHAVNLDNSGRSVWALGSRNRLAQVDVADGTVLKEISKEQIIKANPSIDILELRRVQSNDLSGNSRNTRGRWLHDPYHPNDVEPLPVAYAEKFPDFEPGDLLISARSLNLIFVLDPDDLKVKWWRIGATQRQHDADWQPNGEITAFNNRMGRDYSQIVAIDPTSFKTRIVYDGRGKDFYSRIRGNHEILPSGHIVITSPQQGRAFEIDQNQDIVLEILSTKPGSDDTNLAISEMKRVSPEFVESALLACD